MSTSKHDLIRLFPNLNDYELKKICKDFDWAVRLWDEFVALLPETLKDMRLNTAFLDEDGTVCIMHGPGGMRDVPLQQTFYEDGKRAGEQWRLTFKNGIIYSYFYKGEWHQVNWTGDKYQRDLMQDWKPLPC